MKDYVNNTKWWIFDVHDPGDLTEPVTEPTGSVGHGLGNHDTEGMTFPQRLEEILARYPDNSPVHTAMRHARATLAAQIQRTTDRLTLARHSP